MRVYIDTNVVIAHFTASEPAHEDAVALMALALSGAFEAVMDVSQLSDIGHIMGTPRRRGALTPVQCVESASSVATIVAAEPRDMRRACALPAAGRDLEDALRCAVAERTGCDYIATGNLKHFDDSPVPALSIEAAIVAIGTSAEAAQRNE